jgi:hypothetical protein
MWSLPRNFLEYNWGDPVSCQLTDSLFREEACVKWPPDWEFSVGREFFAGSCEERTCALDVEKYSLLEAVDREQLMKAKQAAKGSVGTVVVCKMWRLMTGP